MVQGGLVQGTTVPGTKVWVDGRKVRVSPQGMFLVGFGRDASQRVKLAITYPNGKKEHRVLSIKKRKYKIQRINGLPPRKVNPHKRDLARIQEDARLAKIAQGDFIAELGKSGRATGPHLDWRMNLFTQRIDPQLLVSPMSAN